jgi:hypothetical protein
MGWSTGGAGLILGMDLTPPVKDDPIDPVKLTGAMIRRFWSGVRGALIPFFQAANFRW